MLKLVKEDAIYLSERMEKILLKEFKEDDELLDNIQKLQIERRVLVEEHGANKTSKRNIEGAIDSINELLNYYFGSYKEDRAKLLGAMRKQRNIRKKETDKVSLAQEANSVVKLTTICVSLKNKKWLELKKKKYKCKSLNEVIDKMKKRLRKKTTKK